MPVSERNRTAGHSLSAVPLLSPIGMGNKMVVGRVYRAGSDEQETGRVHDQLADRSTHPVSGLIFITLRKFTLWQR
jgi:hypothetical protein